MEIKRSSKKTNYQFCWDFHRATFSHNRDFFLGVSEPGLFKSVAFFVATTSWVSSLLINISPFMRFDGYYVFADYLKVDNLQPRAFALAKWRLREILFGLNINPQR